MKTHGRSRTPIYICWAMMKQRCGNPLQPSYKNYGARGIRVCESWQSFEPFLDDMGEKPRGKSLGRIDNDGNYEPTNCRWEDLVEQGNNRRTNCLITSGGETLSIAQWSRKIGVSRESIWRRINAYGWPPEKAVSIGRIPLGTGGNGRGPVWTKL